MVSAGEEEPVGVLGVQLQGGWARGGGDDWERVGPPLL